MPRVVARAVVLITAILAQAAQAQESSRFDVAGCYVLKTVEGQDLPQFYTRPPAHFRLDLLRDARTGAEYSYVVQAMSDSPHFLQLDRWWRMPAADAVEVFWNGGFWGLRVSFPAATLVAEGIATSWSDMGGDVEFAVEVRPVQCDTLEWVQQLPVKVFPL